MPDEARRDCPQHAEIIFKAIYSLLDKVREANRLYREGEILQREATIDVLLAAEEFLLLVTDRSDHQQPITFHFDALLNALMSLDKGEVLPVLKPRRRPGSPRDSAGKGVVKGMAAHVIERLVAAGLNLDEAYEKVAGVLRQAGITPGRKGARDQRTETTARTVRGWCERIAADVGRERLSARQFDSMTACYAAGGTKPEYVGALLETLLRFLVDTGASAH
jgi:hypothetical protein